MNKLFFSIIIPTYNRSKFLKTTIQSVLMQTFNGFEIIVIDDGSTDDTASVVNNFKNFDSRVSYFFQQNSERAIARNNGVLRANGQFLIFLDSDDSFSESDHLSRIYEFIRDENFKEALFFTGARIKCGDKEFLSKDYNKDEINQIDFFINESVIPARVCLSKSIFENFKFDDDCIVVEDTVLWTAISDIYKVFYIPIYSVTYLLHDDNSVNIKKSNAYKKRLIGLKKLFNKYDVGSKISFKTKQNQLNRCYLGISEFYFNNHNLFLSKLWILISIFRYPHIGLKHKLKMLLLH